MNSIGKGLEPTRVDSRSPETDTTAQGRSSAGLVRAAPKAVMAPTADVPRALATASPQQCGGDTCDGPSPPDMAFTAVLWPSHTRSLFLVLTAVGITACSQSR